MNFKTLFGCTLSTKTDANRLVDELNKIPFISADTAETLQQGLQTMLQKKQVQPSQVFTLDVLSKIDPNSQCHVINGELVLGDTSLEEYDDHTTVRCAIHTNLKQQGEVFFAKLGIYGNVGEIRRVF